MGLAQAIGTASPTVPAVGGAVLHTVAQGDTLQSIAAQYGVPAEDIATANGVSVDGVLTIGQELAIPGEVPPATETPAPGKPRPAVRRDATDDATATESATATEVPAPTDIPAATATPQMHTIGSGESLNYLAAQYGVSADDIAAANGITKDTLLSVGQVLTIPAPTARPVDLSPGQTATAVAASGAEIYVVTSGDTLRWISAHFDVSMDAILAANGLTEQSVLKVGQQLVIPNESTAQQAAAPTAPPTATATATATPTVAATPAADVTAEATEEAVSDVAVTPGPVIYEVQGGDTLGAIGARYGVDPDRIAEANDLTLRSILSVGQLLVIPDVTPTPAPTEAATAADAAPTADTSVMELLPTRDPGEISYPYRAPVLLVPTNGSLIWGEDTPVVLAWTSVGVLSANEWYLLTIETPEGPANPVQVWTRATSYRVPDELYPGLRHTPRLAWRVTVVQRPTESDASTPLSLPSPLYSFTWK